MKNAFIILIILAVCNIASSQQLISVNVQSNNDSSALLPVNFAVEAALEYCGFSKLPEFSKESSIGECILDTLLEPPINFLDSLVYGRVIWKIEFRHLNFDSERETSRLPESFVVNIDAYNLKLLGVHSLMSFNDTGETHSDHTVDYRRIPSKSISVNCMGLGVVKPKNTLVELISGTSELGTRYTCGRVSAYFLDCSLIMKESGPTWCIICWGTPVPPPNPPGGLPHSGKQASVGTSMSFIDDTDISRRSILVQ